MRCFFKALWVMLSKSISMTTCQYMVYVETPCILAPSTWEKCKQSIGRDLYSSLCLMFKICKTRNIDIKMSTQNVCIQSS